MKGFRYWFLVAMLLFIQADVVRLEHPEYPFGHGLYNAYGLCALLWPLWCWFYDNTLRRVKEVGLTIVAVRGYISIYLLRLSFQMMAKDDPLRASFAQTLVAWHQELVTQFPRTEGKG